MTAPVLSSDKIVEAVREYLRAIASGTAETISDLYAEDATLEDPVGSEKIHGRAAIRAFYSKAEGLKHETELLTIRVAGNSAAFLFRVRVDVFGQVEEVQPIDVMTFDSDARITSMRAFWSEGDQGAIS